MRSAFVSLLFLLSCGLFATEASLTAELASRNAFLGDAVSLEIRVKHDPAYTVLSPTLGEKLGEGAVLAQTLVPAGSGETPHDYTQVLISIAWYRLGEFKVPPITIQLEGAGLEPHSLDTPELTVEIVNMLKEEDEKPAPAKDQVGLAVPSALPYLILTLCLLGIAAAIITWLLLRKKAPEEPPPPPPEPPYEEAIEALRDLQSGSLLKEGKYKEFYVAVNLIIRHYYARLFAIHAEEMTSFEVEAWLEDNLQLVPDELFYLNRAFQDQCDRVKFAKHDPVEAENKDTTNRAYQIVEMLKPMALTLKEEAKNVALG